MINSKKELLKLANALGKSGHKDIAERIKKMAEKSVAERMAGGIRGAIAGSTIGGLVNPAAAPIGAGTGAFMGSRQDSEKKQNKSVAVNDDASTMDLSMPAKEDRPSNPKKIGPWLKVQALLTELGGSAMTGAPTNSLTDGWRGKNTEYAWTKVMGNTSFPKDVTTAESLLEAKKIEKAKAARDAQLQRAQETTSQTEQPATPTPASGTATIGDMRQPEEKISQKDFFVAGNTFMRKSDGKLYFSRDSGDGDTVTVYPISQRGKEPGDSGDDFLTAAEQRKMMQQVRQDETVPAKRQKYRQIIMSQRMGQKGVFKHDRTRGRNRAERVRRSLS